ncbi:MAG: carbamoyltransferase HypF, partial [Planctomycetes bacterium]|nr:carbamoyltransferase HypF [Planctomycetota bacterium]
SMGRELPSCASISRLDEKRYFVKCYDDIDRIPKAGGPEMTMRTVQVTISGAAQGCGVRPALARMANHNQWSGFVRNTVSGVELVLSGRLPTNNRIQQIIIDSLPTQAVIHNVEIHSHVDVPSREFVILESTTDGMAAAPIPGDVAICSECLSDVRDPQNRRFRYAFTSCAVCGPRYSLIESMPFDRSRTSLRRFPMCQDCEREYSDPTNRRFHAQTICCPTCGPQVWLNDFSGSSILKGDESIRSAAQAILDGKIVAIRGVGGYQLVCDATSSAAITRLRDRKRRPEKPLAIMCRTLTDATACVELNAGEIEQLTSLINPIVIARQKPDSLMPVAINPGLNQLGVFLPTTAMHDRLLELVNRPLICTSGNTNGNPLAY